MDTPARTWERFFLEVTNRCNFDCLFCPSGISARSRRDMSEALALGIVDQLQALHFTGMLYFHVLGEPLLHPAILRLVDHAAAVGMRPILFTNGGALTDEIVQGILASRAHELVISMQTICRSSYEALRHTPFSWDIYLGRIQRALAAAQVSTEGCSFRVSMGIKKADPEHPEDTYFLDESPMQIKESIADLFEGLGADLKPVYAAVETYGPEHMPDLHLSERLSLSVKPMGNWRRVWREEPVAAGKCPFLGREMAVLSHGAVTFCHIDYDGRTAIGNIQETSLADLIAAPSYRQMLAGYYAGRSVPPACAQCRGLKA